MVQQVSTNTFFAAKWIVDPTASQGTHTTISAALSAASSGDTILVRGGTYTENLTLVAGVNITALPGAYDNPTVTIQGKCSFSAAGTVTLSNIYLETNNDYILSVTGSAASIVYLNNCYLNCSNHTGINYTSSSSSSTVVITDCQGNLATTGIAFFSSSSPGILTFFKGSYINSGASVTASSTNNGSVYINYCGWQNPLSTSSTASLIISYTNLNTAPSGPGINSTCVAMSGTSTLTIQYCDLLSGSAACITVGSGCTADIQGPSRLDCTATNAITGSGTLNYALLTFTGTTTTISVTTATAYTTQPVT